MRHKLVIALGTLLIVGSFIVAKLHQAETLAMSAVTTAEAKLKAEEQQLSIVKSAVQKQCQADLKLYQAIPATTRAKYPGPVCAQ